MRDSCLYCARKHLAQACALDCESRQGYPAHRWLAIGHLAEAGDELVKEHSKLAAKIRQHRKKLESNPRYNVPYIGLIESVSALEGSSMNGLFYGDPTLGQIGTTDMLPGMGEELNVRIGNQPQLLRLDIPKRPETPEAKRVRAVALKRGDEWRQKRVQGFDTPLPHRSPQNLRRRDQHPDTIQLPAPGDVREFKRRVATAQARVKQFSKKAKALARQAEQQREAAVQADTKALRLAKQAQKQTNLIKKNIVLLQADRVAAKGRQHAARANALQATAKEMAAEAEEAAAVARTNAQVLREAR